MRVVQALHWLKDTLVSDREAIGESRSRQKRWEGRVTPSFGEVITSMQIIVARRAQGFDEVMLSPDGSALAPGCPVRKFRPGF